MDISPNSVYGFVRQAAGPLAQGLRKTVPNPKGTSWQAKLETQFGDVVFTYKGPSQTEQPTLVVEFPRPARYFTTITIGQMLEKHLDGVKLQYTIKV